MTSSALDAETIAYNKRQWDHIYESTVEFGKFIAPWAQHSKSIFDLGCGAGANTVYLSKQFDARFTGVDISRELLDIARNKVTGVNFLQADMNKLPEAFGVDGVISLQTFSWMRAIEEPLHQICFKLKPKWFAFSSLFYDGDISCEIIVHEPKRPRESYYNIYSIPRTITFLKKYGYLIAALKPFDIGCDLSKSKNPDLMQTYTETLEDGRRLQISGPLMLPWYFMCFEKTK